MKTKPILAFDTATTGASIALMVNGTVTTRALPQTAQAAQLIPAIDGLLKEANVTYADLAAIITTIGPGSFTGVRIGLAALHGFVLVHGTPIKTVTTLQAMALLVKAERFIIALKAGKGEVCAQQFERVVIPAQAGISGQLHPANDSRFHGNDDVAQIKPITEIALYSEAKTDWDAPCFGNQLPVEDANYIAGPDAATLCRAADQLPTTSLTDAMPLYIRPPDAAIGAPLPWLAAH